MNVDVRDALPGENELQPVEGIDPVSHVVLGNGCAQKPGMKLREELHDGRIVDR